MIFFHVILHPAILLYDFHIFITSLLDPIRRVIEFDLYILFVLNQLSVPKISGFA